MKCKIIECEHELDLQDELNKFIKEGHTIIQMHYSSALCDFHELQYSFSCLILYEDRF